MQRSRFNFSKITSGLVRGSAALLLAGMAMSASATAAERVMIVLDGSGSMWGQIDGVPKLTIARQTLREVLQGVPQSTELGLISYGHREKGNCSDIELIVPAALGTSEQIADEVDALRFLGKTPLTDAVQLAAEELRYTEDKATVILITDGIETCEADPCALGNLLESQGVDFTAHVVGFGLSEEEGRQVSCLATNTGGQYFSADDGDSLVVALNEVVAAPTPEVTFVAVDQNGNQVSDIELSWMVQSMDGDAVGEMTGSGNYSEVIEPGNYMVLVEGEDIAGGTEFNIDEDSGSQTIEVPVEITILQATLDAPDEVAIGAEFEVIWTGPDARSDYITIVEVGAREGTFINYGYTKNGMPALVTAPDGLGTYELRYVHGPSDKTLATREIILVGVEGTLEAPKTVAAGAEFEVTWTGPDNRNDFITIVEVGADEGKYGDYAYTRNGSPATLKAPDALGAFELRYVLNQSDRTLASRQITITAVEGTLEAPDSVTAGADFEVIWTGPDNQNDFITIVEVGADEGNYGDYAYTRNGSPATITAPDGLGAYELRYVMNGSDRTLASRPIELTAISGTLEIVNNPVPGGKLLVTWTGPDNGNDFITIVEVGTPEGKYTDYAYTRNGSPAEIDVPRALGAYEVRYVLNQSNRTLVSVPVTLSPASAEVSSAASIKAGAALEVTWTGPGNREDFIEIVAAGAEADANPVSEARTIQGSPLSLFAPGSAGEYEVRYKMRDTGEVLASIPLKVE